MKTSWFVMTRLLMLRTKLAVEWMRCAVAEMGGSLAARIRVLVAAPLDAVHRVRRGSRDEGSVMLNREVPRKRNQWYAGIEMATPIIMARRVLKAS